MGLDRALIEVRDLERTFIVRKKTGRIRRTATEVHAVQDLSFKIGAGEMVGYIGPNGAGKSTTIDHGGLVFDGPLPELQRTGGSTRTLVVDLVDEAPPIKVEGATTRRVEGPRQWLSFPADASAAPIVAAVAATYDVADLSIQEPDIEDVIRELYSR